MSRTALGGDSDGSAESRAGLPAGGSLGAAEKRQALSAPGRFRHRGAWCGRLFRPGRSRDRQLAAHIVGYTDGGRRAFEETNYVPIF